MGSQVKNPGAHCHQRRHFKAMTNVMNTRSHGGECFRDLDHPGHTQRSGLAAPVSTKTAKASCAWVIVKCSSTGMWAGNQKLCCLLIWCPTWKKIVTGTKPSRGNGNLIPLTSSPQKIAIVTGLRCWIFVGLGRNIFVSEMELTVEWIKVNYLSDDWRRFMQYSIIERGY